MHNVSRTLLLAGVLAFGTLTAACGDKVVVGDNKGPVGVLSVLVSPPAATINVGTTILLAASVSADATTAKTVAWSTSNAAVASVDQTGRVTGVSAGTVTIVATATADASKTSAAVITVVAPAVVILVPPSIAINSVTDVTGAPVQLGNANGQLNVTVNTSGGGLIEVFLSTSCTTNTISTSDVAVASQQASSAQAGQVTLSFNTAQLTAANAPRFVNANYCIKARLTNGPSVVIATNTIPLTLTNVNSFRATASFVSQTTDPVGPTSAVSTLNGLNYNQGTLTATLSPVIFTSASPVALISGFLTRDGEQFGGASPGVATFTNVAVTAGVATIVFPDTAGAPAGRSIFQYTSLPAGDMLVITSATDAAGNSIAIPGGGVPAAGIIGLRIDNDIPNNALTTYAVNASNGYLAAAYAFSSGNGGTAAADNRGGVLGVGGLSTIYYVGTAGSAAFAIANSCNIAGLTAAITASDLANTTNNTTYAAKVVVRDALGNKTCRDVAGTFGVDKIAPIIADSTGNNGVVARDQFGYNASRVFAFSLIDTISGFTATPLRGTIVRNFYGTPSAADCVVGAFNIATTACAAVNFANGTEITNNSGINAYYTINTIARDQAGNVTGSVTKTVAFDNVAPTLGALTQSPAAVAPLGTVTISGTATDNLDLAGNNGNLSYVTAPAPFQAVAGTGFGPNFDAAMVTSGTGSVSISNVFRGLQSTAGGVIQANAAVPVGNMFVSDVGGNLSALQSIVIATTTPATNVQVGNQFTITPTSTAPATRQTSTTMTVRVIGSSADLAFQSQPFATVEIYRLIGGELRLVASNSLAAVSDNAGVRTYTYTSAGVALGTGAAGTYTFYAVGRTTAGDAVISGATAIVNP